MLTSKICLRPCVETTAKVPTASIYTHFRNPSRSINLPCCSLSVKPTTNWQLSMWSQHLLQNLQAHQQQRQHHDGGGRNGGHQEVLLLTIAHIVYIVVCAWQPPVAPL